MFTARNVNGLIMERRPWTCIGHRPGATLPPALGHINCSGVLETERNRRLLIAVNNKRPKCPLQVFSDQTGHGSQVQHAEADARSTTTTEATSRAELSKVCVGLNTFQEGR